MKLKLSDRLHVCWLALTQSTAGMNALIQGSIIVNKCILRGDISGEARLKMDDGKVAVVEYRLVSREENTDA